MRRHLCIFLIFSLFLCLCGCSFGNDIKDPVNFYYLRNSDSFVYGSENGVITPEIRESSGHTRDLSYLLSLYLRGPLDTELKSPFPSGCRIVEIRRESKALHLTLDGVFAQLENLDLTLACACLAKTCFDMSDAQEVKIDAVAPDGNSIINITFNRDSLVLEDNSVLPSQVEAEDHQ